MPKYTPNNLVSLTNQTSAISAINDNFDRIKTAIEKTLSRDGTTPNTMSSVIDMNSNRIINLAAPTQANDAVRLYDIQTYLNNSASALALATAANLTSGNALTVANSALATANTTISTANTASTTANTAITNATNALSIASGLSASVTAAVNTANTASTNANNASTAANNAAASVASKLSANSPTTDVTIRDLVARNTIFTQVSVAGDVGVLGLLSGKYDIGQTGSVSRFWISKALERVSVKDFGCVGDDSTDDTYKFQKAIDYAQANGDRLYIPPVPSGYRLTSTLNISNGLTLEGVYPRPFIGEGLPSYGISSRGKGSWLHFDHSNRGIQVASTDSNRISGVLLRDFGTFRNQPAIYSGWQPYNHDYDITAESADLTCKGLMLYNPSRGILAHQGGNGYGAFHAEDIRGQPFIEGITLRDQFREAVLDNVRWWSYWSQDPQVHDYMLSNRTALNIFKADGVMCTNFVSVWHAIGIRFLGDESGDQYPTQGSKRGMFSNVYLDLGVLGVQVNSGCQGATAQFSNMQTFGCAGYRGGSYGFVNDGTYTNFNFNNWEASNIGKNMFRSGGSGTFLLTNITSEGWNQDNDGSVAFSAENNNTIRYNPLSIFNGNGASFTGGPGNFLPN